MWEELVKMTCFVTANALIGCLIGTLFIQEGRNLLFVVVGFLLIVSIFAFIDT